MLRSGTRSQFLLVTSLLLLLSVGACGDTAGPEPKEGLAFLVGTWAADVLEVTSVAPPVLTTDLIGGGGSFLINVQPSGQYTATLTVGGIPATEIGTLEVAGSSVTLYAQFPLPDTAEATLTQLGENRIRLEGSTTFQFDPIRGPEEATLKSELNRQTES